jgi:Ca2+-binding EF-hand superfamily protein
MMLKEYGAGVATDTF